METKNKSHRYDCVSIDGDNTPNDSNESKREKERMERKQIKNTKRERERAHTLEYVSYIDMMINNIGQKFIVCRAIAWEIKRNEFQIVPFRCYN